MIEYRWKKFPWYNKPIKSSNPKKKKMVLAKKWNEIKLIHFWDASMWHNYSAEARKSYLARSSWIKDKSGNDTSKDKLSANYWSRKVLWWWPKWIKKSPPKK